MGQPKGRIDSREEVGGGDLLGDGRRETESKDEDGRPKTEAIVIARSTSDPFIDRKSVV